MLTQLRAELSDAAGASPAAAAAPEAGRDPGGAAVSFPAPDSGWYPGKLLGKAAGAVGATGLEQKLHKARDPSVAAAEAEGGLRGKEVSALQLVENGLYPV